MTERRPPAGMCAGIPHIFFMYAAQSLTGVAVAFRRRCIPDLRVQLLFVALGFNHLVDRISHTGKDDSKTNEYDNK